MLQELLPFALLVICLPLFEIGWATEAAAVAAPETATTVIERNIGFDQVQIVALCFIFGFG